MHYSQDPFTKHHNDCRKKINKKNKIIKINRTTIVLALAKPKQTLKINFFTSMTREK
jgi:hypothetical protein